MWPPSRHLKHDPDVMTVFLFDAKSRLSNLSQLFIWWFAPHAAHPVVLGVAPVDFCVGGADDVVDDAATFATFDPFCGF